MLLNGGTGTFSAKAAYTTGSQPYAIGVGDFNRDGKPDLAVGNYYSNTVSILINAGAGIFAGKVDYNTGRGPTSVGIADMNGDGKADLVVSNRTGNTISVFLNDGAGTFPKKLDYGTALAPFSIAVTDLNGDGRPDVAVTNHDSKTLSISLNAPICPKSPRAFDTLATESRTSSTCSRAARGGMTWWKNVSERASWKTATGKARVPPAGAPSVGPCERVGARRAVPSGVCCATRRTATAASRLAWPQRLRGAHFRRESERHDGCTRSCP